jgi:uncharacterized protein
MIIVDSGYWLGLLDKRDVYHPAYRAFLVQCSEPLITTFPVLTEALHLLMRREAVRLGLELLKLLSKLRFIAGSCGAGFKDRFWLAKLARG